MKTMSASASASRERRALGEKAVARMDSLGACLEAGGDDLVDREIGLGRGGRADRDRLIRHLDMQRILVRFGIDGDGPDAHAARRLDDATGDLAAVGDQDCLEHRALARKAPCFPSTVISMGTTEAGKQPKRLALGLRSARPGSGADFDLSPRVLQSRAGKVAAISRPEIRRGERRSGPRKAAEAKVAGANFPLDPLGRVAVGLSFGCARLTKDAEPEKSDAASDAAALVMAEIPLRSRPGALALLEPPHSDSARLRRPQGASG